MEIYVKEIPPARGNVDTVIFLFDTPGDPEQYSWQATWYAEHAQESTLCFYATPFLNNMIAPGIGQSRYGGALFMFPPRPIPDIWTDEALGFARPLEERLIAAGAVHSRDVYKRQPENPAPGFWSRELAWPVRSRRSRPRSPPSSEAP